MRHASLILSAAALLAGASSASALTLFGVSLGGASSGSAGPSSLYTIDMDTGAGTLVGSIGYAVNSLTWDPVTKVLYGSTTSWSQSYTGDGFNGLLAIDLATGAGAPVGTGYGAAYQAVVSLEADGAGGLYAWHDPSEDDLVMVDPTTGLATRVGESGLGTGGHTMAFGPAGELLLFQGSSIHELDLVTGAATSVGSLTHSYGNGDGEFRPGTDQLWAPRESGLTADSFIRITSLLDGTFQDIDTDVTYLNAVAFGDYASAAVPVPAALPLLGGALAALGFVARRRRA